MEIIEITTSTWFFLDANTLARLVASSRATYSGASDVALGQFVPTRRGWSVLAWHTLADIFAPNAPHFLRSVPTNARLALKPSHTCAW